MGERNFSTGTSFLANFFSPKWRVWRKENDSWLIKMREVTSIFLNFSWEKNPSLIPLFPNSFFLRSEWWGTLTRSPPEAANGGAGNITVRLENVVECWCAESLGWRHWVVVRFCSWFLVVFSCEGETREAQIWGKHGEVSLVGKNSPNLIESYHLILSSS